MELWKTIVEITSKFIMLITLRKKENWFEFKILFLFSSVKCNQIWLCYVVAAIRCMEKTPYLQLVSWIQSLPPPDLIQAYTLLPADNNYNTRQIRLFSNISVLTTGKHCPVLLQSLSSPSPNAPANWVLPAWMVTSPALPAQWTVVKIHHFNLNCLVDQNLLVWT